MSSNSTATQVIATTVQSVAVAKSCKCLDSICKNKFIVGSHHFTSSTSTQLFCQNIYIHSAHCIYLYINSTNREIELASLSQTRCVIMDSSTKQNKPSLDTLPTTGNRFVMLRWMADTLLAYFELRWSWFCGIRERLNLGDKRMKVKMETQF